MSRRRGRQPTAEERALWAEVANSLRRRAETAVEPPAPTIPSKPVIANAPPPPPFAPPPRATLRPTGRTGPPANLSAPRMAAPSGLDRATETRLRRGKRAPDARLDLHGMTAERAHRALIGFVERSREAGHRCLLVITGKGGPHDGAPGILRREAPHWLETPPLASMIVNVSPAHPRHGGGGALYVYLKRRR
ncbi:MAG: Smr/MutS family protein [Pikeienuella sp.]